MVSSDPLRVLSARRRSVCAPSGRGHHRLPPIRTFVRVAPREHAFRRNTLMTHHTRRLRTTLVGLAGLMALSAAARAQTYNIVDLGSLAGGTSAGRAINSSGQVAGESVAG